MTSYALGGRCHRGHLLTERVLLIRRDGEHECRLCRALRRQANVKGMDTKDLVRVPDATCSPLRRVRAQAGITTLSELGELTGVGWKTLWDADTDPHHQPTMHTLRCLAVALGEAIWHFYGFESVGHLLRRQRGLDSPGQRQHARIVSLANAARAERQAAEWRERAARMETARGG